MHIEPIRATTTEERQIDSQHFTVRKNDHDKAVALFAGILNYQKAHPEIYYYTRSRSFFREDPTNPDHEIWMFIDEYDNRAVYWQSLLDAAANDANGAANLAAWQALVVPPPPTGHIVWTEIQELRVQFRFREPLWPGCPDKEDTAQDVPKDAITATPTADTQIDEGSFIIRKTDHDAIVPAFRVALDFQQTHPEIFYYTRTRLFFRDDPTNPNHEIVTFFDEYDNRDTYMQALTNGSSHPEIRARAAGFLKYVVKAPSGHSVWTELQELRVEFKFREPLWPACRQH